MRFPGKMAFGTSDYARTVSSTLLPSAFIAVALSACSGGSGQSASSAPNDLNPAVAPGGNFALDHFSLTIPADSNGSNTGTAVTIPSTQITGPTGYQSKYFYTDTDGAMTFFTPHNGAALENAPHPRCELREQIVANSDTPNWDETGSSIMDAELKVTSVPSDNEIIVGQIHGFNTGPLAIIFYDYQPADGFGRLVGEYHTSPDEGSAATEYKLLDGLTLGEKFSYHLSLVNGVLTMSSPGGTPVVITIDPSWSSQTFYFKAGDYLASVATTTDFGQVSFYSLAACHPNEGLAISTPAALPNASAGASYSTTLTATSGSGSYTWELASGNPPDGLSLSASGVLSGTPASDAVSTSAHTFTAIVRDTDNNSLAQTFSILVQ